MHEKMGLAQDIGKILDSQRVQSMDPHEQHALARKLKEIRSREELLKQYPRLRYD